MLKRVAILMSVMGLAGAVTVVASASAGQGATAVASKKKKKKKKKKVLPPQIAVGTYTGQTSNGIPMSVTLNGDRATGTMTYCAMTAPITVSGVSFTVAYMDPAGDTINAAGQFNASTRQATGSVAPYGCDASNQSFTLQAP